MLVSINVSLHRCVEIHDLSYFRMLYHLFLSLKQMEKSGFFWLFMFLAKFSILSECTDLQSALLNGSDFYSWQAFHMEVNKLLMPLIKALLPRLYLLKL